MRIAILLTDVDDSDFTRSFPDDADKFRRLMTPLRPHWDYVTYAVRDGVFPAELEAHDGILITGSPASVHDDRPWIPKLFALIRQGHARRMPMVGACFGHQAIAMALGGMVGRNGRGWGLGATETTFVRRLPFMRPERSSLRFYCAHNEQVTRLPPGAVVIGSDPIAEVSAYVIGEHVLCTQHHPEMTPDYVDGLLDYMRDDVDETVMARARASVRDGAEGEVFARWMADFLERARGAREDGNHRLSRSAA